MTPGKLHCPNVDDLGPGSRQLEHLLIADVIELGGLRDHPRIGTKNAIDIRIDFTHFGTKRRGQRHRSRV